MGKSSLGKKRGIIANMPNIIAQKRGDQARRGPYSPKLMEL